METYRHGNDTKVGQIGIVELTEVVPHTDSCYVIVMKTFTFRLL
jgi:hypothetical protein